MFLLTTDCEAGIEKYYLSRLPISYRRDLKISTEI
jgi:hypothetical protein